jgi:mRNA interferase HigB
MRRFFVRVISRRRIREAVQSHPEWKASLDAWYRIAKAAEWENFEELKQGFNRADRVGSCVVFDISHNRCRLVSYINYRSQKLFILHILSHVEYDKDGWKNDCDCGS